MLIDNDVWFFLRKKWIFNRYKYFNFYLDCKLIWFFKGYKKMLDFWFVIRCYMGIYFYIFFKCFIVEIFKFGVYRVYRFFRFIEWF